MRTRRIRPSILGHLLNNHTGVAIEVETEEGTAILSGDAPARQAEGAPPEDLANFKKGAHVEVFLDNSWCEVEVRRRHR